MYYSSGTARIIISSSKLRTLMCYKVKNTHIFASSSPLIQNLILNTKLPKWYNKHCKTSEKKSDPKGTITDKLPSYLLQYLSRDSFHNYVNCVLTSIPLSYLSELSTNSSFSSLQKYFSQLWLSGKSRKKIGGSGTRK